MSDTNAVPMTPAIRDAMARDASVEAANIKFAELQKAYAESPEMKLELDKLRLEQMRNDPHHLGRAIVSEAAANEEAMLVARIRDAETQAAADRLAIDADAGKPVDPYAGEVTYEGMLPARDHAAAVADLLDAGARPALVETFMKTGHGDSPYGRDEEIAAARAWRRRLDNDPEMQRRFLAKDPEIMEKFANYGMYAPDPRRE
jgi:osmotically-inducible protein OsmY